MNKAIFIGQAMPKYKSELHDWPSLNKWLYKIGITDNEIRKYFYYSALVDFFPGIKNGSHRIPSAKEIYKERVRLNKTISDFEPDIIVPVGKLSISHCLNKKNITLTETIGEKYICDPYNLTGRNYLVIPLPHTSGASVWYQKRENRILLKKALVILKRKLEE